MAGRGEVGKPAAGAEVSGRAGLLGGLVFVAALSVRLAYLAGAHESPFFDVSLLQGGDSYRWFVWALKIAEGDWVGEGVFNQSPLYPYFLAVTFKLTGGGNFLVPRLFQAVVGSFTAVLMFAVGRKLFGNLAGALAGLGAAFYGPLIFYDGAILRAFMLCFFNVALIYSMIAGKDRPGFVRSALVGALFGVGVLAKPNIGVMIPALLFWIYEASSKETASGAAFRRAFALRLAGMVLGFCLLMAPLVARNLAAGVGASSMTQRGAQEFINGNHPDTPLTHWQPTEATERMLEQTGGSLVKSVWLILLHYRDDPGALVWRQLEKTWTLFHGYEWPTSISCYVEKRFSPLLGLPWLNWPIALGLCLVGMAAGARKWRQAAPLYGFVVLYSLGLIAFYINARFRIPMAPAVLVFAGAGAAAIIKDLGRRRIKRAATWIVLATMVAAATWPREKDPLQVGDYENLARFHLVKAVRQAGELNVGEASLASARAVMDEGVAKTEAALFKEETAEYRYRLARLRFTGGEPLFAVRAELGRARELDPPRWVLSLIELMERKVEEQEDRGDGKRFGFRY